MGASARSWSLLRQHRQLQHQLHKLELGWNAGGTLVLRVTSLKKTEESKAEPKDECLAVQDERVTGGHFSLAQHVHVV